MPIYEFDCRACGARFERLYPSLKSAEGASPPCEQCGSAERVERAFSCFAIGGGARSEPGSRSGGGASSSCSGCARTSCGGCGAK